MNPTAIKKMEIISSLSHVPDDSLETIKNYIDALISEANMSKSHKGSLKGIWKDKGFEKIPDMDAKLKAIRQELGDSILRKNF